MEYLIIVLALGAGGWFFLKQNTQRGAETVRAYMYLRALAGGASTEEANTIANYDIAEGPTETIMQAMAHVRSAYAGSQLSLIKDAKQAGMNSSPRGR